MTAWGCFAPRAAPSRRARARPVPYRVVEVFDNHDDGGNGKDSLGAVGTGPLGDVTLTVHHHNHHFLTATAMQAGSGTPEFSAPFETGTSRVPVPLVFKHGRVLPARWKLRALCR